MSLAEVSKDRSEEESVSGIPGRVLPRPCLGLAMMSLAQPARAQTVRRTPHVPQMGIVSAGDAPTGGSRGSRGSRTAPPAECISLAPAHARTTARRAPLDAPKAGSAT